MLTTPPIYCCSDDAQTDVLSYLLLNGRVVSPRGEKTLESVAISFTLADPRLRCIGNPLRKWSLPLALGEVCWHLSGSDIASDLGYYALAWNRVADSDGKITGSCYGAKMFGLRDRMSAWENLRRLLALDPSTRRAVIYFGDSNSQFDPECVDASCSTSLQFLVREGKLDAIVCMRSNDAIWGLPYDVFLFTFLQERMAIELDVQLGVYHHFVGSLHIYERHWALANRIARDGYSRMNTAMPPMDHLEALPRFLAAEKELRLAPKLESSFELPSYWNDLMQVLDAFKKSKRRGWEAALRSSSVREPYVSLLRPLFERRPSLAG